MSKKMNNMSRVSALLLAVLMIGLLVTAAWAEGGVATGTDITTGTDIATDTDAKPTEAPTAKPAAPSPTAEPKAPTLGIDSATFAADIAALLGVELAEDAVTVTGDSVTIALDEVCTLAYLYGKVEALVLTGVYDAETVEAFDAWRKSVADPEALNGSEVYGAFIAYAKAVVKTVLPSLTDDEVDALLLVFLASEAADASLDEETLAAVVGEGVSVEILSVLEHETCEFFLMTTEDSIVLCVRAI